MPVSAAFVGGTASPFRVQAVPEVSLHPLCSTALGCAALLLAGAALAAEPPPGAEPSRLREQAAAALARGDAAAALDAYERVAATGHDAAGEMGLVRAQMQAGAYRRALAFGAHVAGEHFDEPAAVLLYAWLLQVGGQQAVADRLVEQTLQRAPGDALALATRRAFASPPPIAAEPLLQVTAQRMAPVALAAPGEPLPPAGARVLSGGVLVDRGHALVPSEVLALVPSDALALVPTAGHAASAPVTGKRFWVRDGLGQTRIATVADALEADSGAAPVAAGLSLLTLQTPLAVPDEALFTAAPRPPFAGSPGHAIEVAATAADVPAWPQLRSGFFGAASGAGGPRRLRIELDAGTIGGPAFDTAGRLAGVVLRDAAGQPVMQPIPPPRNPPAPPAIDATPAAAPRLPEDALYERALRLTLQVIAAP